MTKVNNVSAKKNIEELFLIALNIDAKVDGKMTCAFKNDMGFSKFSTEHVWKSKHWGFDGFFLCKVENV